MAQISREKSLRNNTSKVIQKATYFFEQYIQDTVNCTFHYNEFS